MGTYEYAHGQQRIVLAKLCERLHIQTWRTGAKRRLPLTVSTLRIAIVNRCIGPDCGNVGTHCKTQADIDKWLTQLVECHEGKLGPALKAIQTATYNAYTARWEAVQLWEKYVSYKSAAHKRKALESLSEAQREAANWFDVANDLLDAWQADPKATDAHALETEYVSRLRTALEAEETNRELLSAFYN